ncbi:MAG: glycosyltransferase family 4 protein [Kiritimatiellia bacterium]|jgi:glycosyltransferase involved in cell wall biosynthesis|nr:glycosyltransferase family 4 protein [Kiritimatiellia bacterium]
MDITVLYCDRLHAETFRDETFEADVSPFPGILDGYPYCFVKNYARHRFGGFFSRVNWGIGRHVRQYDAVLINGFGRLTYWLAWAVALLCGKRILIRGEGTPELLCACSPCGRTLRRLTLGAALSVCDAVLHSCSGNQAYWQYHWVPERKLFPLPCAVDNAKLQKEHGRLLSDRSRLRENAGIMEQDFVVIFPARLTHRKHPLDLVAAAAKLMKQGDARPFLLFVGDGPLRADIEHMCLKEGVSHKMVGFVDAWQLGPYYTMADLYAMLSEYDPSPKALNEAMNYGLPIVTTRVVGTASDLVEEGVNGRRIDIGDTDSLAEFMSLLIRDRAQAVAMGRESLCIVGDWSYGKEVEGLVQALESCNRSR